MDIKHSLKIEVRIHFRQEACRALRGRRARRSAAHYLRIYSVRRKEGGEKRERLCGAEPGDLRRGHRKTPDRDSIFNRRSGQDPRYGDLRQRRRAGLRKNEKIKSDTSGGTALEKENFSDEKEYVLIETDGNEGGMIIKLIQPKIRGVAVVCEGGGSDAVRQEITQAITAVLDISASRVYITKMSA